MAKKKTVSVGYQILDNLQKNTDLIGQTQKTTNGYGYSILSRLEKETKEMEARSKAIAMLGAQSRSGFGLPLQQEKTNDGKKTTSASDFWKTPAQEQIRLAEEAQPDITSRMDFWKNLFGKNDPAETEKTGYEQPDPATLPGTVGRQMQELATKKVEDTLAGKFNLYAPASNPFQPVTKQDSGATEETKKNAYPKARESKYVRKKADAILQGMMETEAARAKDAYDAALLRYQRAEENYYAVPDGDFDKAQNDYLAAEEQLKKAERELRNLQGNDKEIKTPVRDSAPERKKDEASQYFTNLIATNSWADIKNAGPSIPSNGEIGAMGVEELQTLQKSIDSYADSVEQTTLAELQGKWRKALMEGRPQPEIDEISKEINLLAKDIQQYRDKAEELSWQINLVQRRNTINAYETYRQAPDFQAVAERAKNTNYSQTEDPLGYYLKHKEEEDTRIALGGQTDKGWNLMTEDERQMYFYLLGAEGSQAAKKYLDDIQINLDQKAYNNLQTAVSEGYGDSSIPEKALINLFGAYSQAVGGIPAVAGDVASALSGSGYNPYNQGHGLLDLSDAIQRNTSEDIKEQLMDDETRKLLNEYETLLEEDSRAFFRGSDSQKAYEARQDRLEQLSEALKEKQDGFDWGNFWAQTYQAVYSGTSSAVGAMIFNKGYTTVMGAGAASQRARELWENGASGKQIAIGAVASGLIEMATEKYSVEYFTENFLKGSIQGPKDWLVKTMIQGFNEASEEVSSEVANLAANAVILGANSDNQREIRSLMEQEGLSREEAEKKAIVNRALDIFWAGYGGFVSGGTMGGIGGPVNTFVNHVSTGNSIIQNQAGQELVQAAKDSGVDEQVRNLAMEKASGDYEAMNAWKRMQAEKEMGKLYEQTVQAQQAQAEQAERDSFQKVAEDKVREAKEAEQSQSQETNGTTQEDPKKAAEALTKAAYGEELTDAEKKTVEAMGGEALIEEIVNSREFQESAAARTEEAVRRLSDTLSMTRDTTQQRELVSSFAKENGMDEGVLLESIRRDQDAYAFTEAWQSAYDMGQSGVALRYAQKASANSYLTQEQIETAYNEGRKAAESYEAEESALPDGGQWNDRAYPGGQVRAVEGGTAAQGQQIQQGAGGGIAEASEKISAAELGIENGTDNRNLRRVAETAYSEDTKAAAKVAKDSGLVFVPFRGGAIETTETVNGAEIKVKSRGCVVNGRMYVRVDDNTFTADQIARHEAAHEQIRKGEIDVEDARKRLLERYSPEEIDAIIQLYSSAYGDCGMSPQEVLVEIICDSLGKMNAFATESTERVAGEVGVFLRNVRKAAKNTGDGGVKRDTNDGGNQDTRYSREMDTVKALERQVELLREQRDYWKDQTRLTKVAKADKDSVRKLGRELLRGYSSRTNVEDILTDLQWLADDAVGQPKASFDEVTDRAEKVARKVLEGSEVDVNADAAEIRKELKKYLKDTPIKVTESIKAGIPDFSDFKKRNRALHFREDGSGTDVDVMWLELQDQFGTGMFPESIMNQEDQVRYIAEELEDIREVMVNPYGMEMELAIQQLTYDILYRTSFETQQKKPTRADKAVERATKEMQQLLEEGRRRETARIENAQKTSIRQQIRSISDKFQRMATRPGKGITQHAPEGLRKAVVDFCEVFTESELRRMDRWQRNLEYRADELGRKASNVNVATGVVAEAEAIQNAQARRDRMTARLTKLQNAYEAMKKDGQYQTTYDETVAEMIKNLSEILGEEDLYQLDIRALRKVQQTMSAIYYTITNANKAFSMGKDKSIIDMAVKWAKEIRQVNPKQAGMMIAGRRFLQWQMSPDTFFSYTCGYIKGNEGKVIQKGFQQGAERMMGVQREFYQMFREFTESKDKAVHKELADLMNYSSKRLVNWGLKDLEGNEVKTPRGMMIQAYMLLNQADSFESLKHGGFSIPNAERYYKGDIAGAYGDAVETTMLSESIGTGYTEMSQRNKDLRSRMEDLQQKIEISETESYKQRYQQEINELEKQIRENQQKMEAISNQAAERLYNLQNAIEKQLTPLEKKLIDRAHEWYSKSGEMMADVFEQMYGYRPILVDNYVPIHRDPTTIKTDIRDMEGAEKAFNLENSGFTIDRVKNSQPILLTDFFGELTRQSDKMARYVGFAQVQKDFGKIWKTRIDSHGMTVNTLVRARFGAGKTTLGVSGEEYVNHYIADVAGGHSSDDILGKLYGNYAAATLRFNPRVAVSQAASIPTAASVVGWKSMAAGFARGVPKAWNKDYRNELAAKNEWFYQRYRGNGGITEISDIKKKGGFFETIANSKTGKLLFNWCQSVDVWATGSIMWSAAEDYVQSKGIAKGSAEYEEEVNRVYTDIIRKSQPNYTTTERSDMLRDQRSHMKLLTMFKTQSNQNLNLLLEANGEYIRMRQDLKNGRNGVTESDVKAARHKLCNAATGVVVGGQLAFVLLRTLVNFAFRLVNPYRDEETDEVTLEATLTAMGKEFLSAMFGTVALGGEIYDVINSVWSGDNFYGLNDSALSTISGVVENSVNILQSWKDEDESVTMNQIWKEVNSLCTVLKIPSGNVKKYVFDMVKSYGTDIKKGDLLAFTSEDTSKKQYRARIVKHYLAGDEDKAADAMTVLWERGTKDTDEENRKQVAGDMRTYLKELYKSGDVSNVEAEKIMDFTGTEDPETYTTMWDLQLAHPDREISESIAKAYNTVDGKIPEEVFLDAWEFAKNAQADKDKNGKTINGSKKQKVVDYIEGLPGLSQSKKKALYVALNVGIVKGTPWE